LTTEVTTRNNRGIAFTTSQLGFQVVVIEGALLGMTASNRKLATYPQRTFSPAAFKANFDYLAGEDASPSVSTTELPIAKGSHDLIATVAIVVSSVSCVALLLVILTWQARYKRKVAKATTRHEAQAAMSQAIKASQVTFREAYPRLELAPMEDIPL
jgi:hypothetical protein